MKVKLIRMLGLTALAALTAMAFGATTASADELCEENISHTSTCNPNARVLKNAKIAGLLVPGTEALLLAPKGTALMHCASSLALGEFLESEGSHKGLWGAITALLFTNCKGACEKAHGFNFPFLLLGLAAQLHAKVTKGIGAAGPPSATLNNCFFQTCKFQINPEPALLKIEGDVLNANEVELKQTTNCAFSPEKAWWDAKYLLTLDTPSHVTPIYITLL